MDFGVIQSWQMMELVKLILYIRHLVLGFCLFLKRITEGSIKNILKSLRRDCFPLIGSVNNNGGMPILKSTSPSKLYITITEDGNVAHNNYNFGNLVGPSAKPLGFSENEVKIGAHYNNYF